MSDKWRPKSKLSDIKFSHYLDDRYSSFTVREHTYPLYQLNLFFDIFKFFPLFIIIEFLVLANMLALLI